MLVSLRKSFSREELPSAARESSGLPFRYLLVRRPWASGENAMHPTPSSSKVASRPPSIQRFSME
jgi:hypothetical protein